MQASILVVGAGYQAVQWACESGILDIFLLGRRRESSKLLLVLKLKSGSRFVWLVCLVLFSLFFPDLKFFFWN